MTASFASSPGLWGLVNNAGISTFGEVEFTSMDTYKEVAEVNLWGTIRTTKAFLPLIRRAKGKRGPRPPPPPWNRWTQSPIAANGRGDSRGRRAGGGVPPSPRQGRIFRARLDGRIQRRLAIVGSPWGAAPFTAPLPLPPAGRVVNISSMMGRMANPARSPYCITKFGVEAFSDCLRYEMRPHDVKVCIVEPGNFIAGTSLYSPERIQSIADKMWDELPEIVRRDYGRKYFDEQIAKMESYCSSGSSDTSPVVESIGHALTSTTPYTRYHPMDYYWWLRMQVMTHMPAAISDRLYIY